jgi:hypothetical protein
MLFSPVYRHFSGDRRELVQSTMFARSQLILITFGVEEEDIISTLQIKKLRSRVY